MNAFLILIIILMAILGGAKKETVQYVCPGGQTAEAVDTDSFSEPYERI